MTEILREVYGIVEELNARSKSAYYDAQRAISGSEADWWMGEATAYGDASDLLVDYLIEKGFDPNE